MRLLKTLCTLLCIVFEINIIACCEMLQLWRLPARNVGVILSNLLPTTRWTSTCRTTIVLITQSMKKVSKTALELRNRCSTSAPHTLSINLCNFTFEVHLNNVGSVKFLPEYTNFPLAFFVPCTLIF